MKNTITRIIAGLLAIAIVLTGVSVDATTAHAATDKYAAAGIENLRDLQNTTITMKIGDTKMINCRETLSLGYVMNETKEYDWSTSDETVVSMKKGFAWSSDGINTYLSDLTLTAEKAGTAVITATHETTSETLSFTVIVEGQKMTAKQKKCSHKFKTTKKATCYRMGVKTCKKCKLQKTIAKKNHKFETNYEEKATYREYPIFVCNGCPNKDIEVRKAHRAETRKTGRLCDDVCLKEFSEKEYGTMNAAYEAYKKHMDEDGGHGETVSERVAREKVKTEIVPVERCVYCEETKEDIEKYS